MLISIRISTFILLISLISFLQPLYSQDQSISINFFNLGEVAQHNGQLVTIRGFLYESPEASMVLAAEPNLKSCCVGSASKREKQLLVVGDLDSTDGGGNAVTLQGNLVVAMGDKFPLRLENARVVPQKDQCYWVLGLVGVGLVLLSGATFFFVRKRL